MDAESAGRPLWGVQILYVSPLKSLANDVQKNLLRAEYGRPPAAYVTKDHGRSPIG